MTCPDLKLLVHQSCSRYAWESSTMRRRERLMFMSSSADGSGDALSELVSNIAAVKKCANYPTPELRRLVVQTGVS